MFNILNNRKRQRSSSRTARNELVNNSERIFSPTTKDDDQEQAWIPEQKYETSRVRRSIYYTVRVNRRKSTLNLAHSSKRHTKP